MNHADIYVPGLTQAEYVWLVMTADPILASRRKGMSFYRVDIPYGVERLSFNMATLGLVTLGIAMVMKPPET